VNKDEVVKVLAALGAGTRMDAFLMLVEAGERGVTAGEIAVCLGLQPSLLSHHLNELRAAGLASCERRHRQVIYRADLGAIGGMLGFLVERCTGEPPETLLPGFRIEDGRRRMSDTTADHIYNVLFLCTGNSARSIIGESIINRVGMGRFRGFSAGSQPAGQVNPHALALLTKMNYSTEGLRSKNWDEFAEPGAPQMDFVFTVCDNAANEVCPIWPGQPMSAHWGVPDPAAATGTDAEIGVAFAETHRMLYNRISIFCNLPLQSLDRLALQERLREIGSGADDA
jgi:protein-tyrosine-phosphatase/DNA-binding transcriptional ArsR family regulator